MDIPNECHGYKVVQMKCDVKSETIHYLYMKEHSVREICDEKPPDRTVFILGTPPFVTEDHYKQLFSRFGSVQQVYFHPSPCATAPPKNLSKFFVDYPEVKGYKVAYIVFEDESSVHNVMNLDFEEILVLFSKENPQVAGMNKWCNEYNSKLMDVEELQKDIDEFMAEYDKKEEEEANKEKKEMEPDDEGWIKVTKKGRKPGFARKESVHNKIMKKEDVKKKKKQLLNFYRFQIRESKMNQLVKLREKFEEDKKKIALLKQSRKFRPF
ncbi:ribosomal RNA-processing protein 7 homolog A [Rhodnius prolixus]|uniref:ribosomal RNA-processing protein 7 homolog A n=1 Tax=Rhodnius prolixus TaxID=13249 RepID=UPI003D18B7DD